MSNKFLNFNKILCLSPHPDDVEYSMAGTILKYSDTVFDISCLTPGGNFDSTNDFSLNEPNPADSRWQECEYFWKGVKNVNLIFSKKNYLDQEVDFIISDVEKNYFTKYDAILAPCKEDNHFFHVKVNSLAGALARTKKLSIIEYFTPSSKIEWTPNMVVELSDSLYFDKKLRLKRFFSQSHRTYFNEFCLDSFHTDLYFSKKDVKWVEKFKHILSFQ